MAENRGRIGIGMLRIGAEWRMTSGIIDGKKRLRTSIIVYSALDVERRIKLHRRRGRAAR